MEHNYVGKASKGAAVLAYNLQRSVILPSEKVFVFGARVAWQRLTVYVIQDIYLSCLELETG